MGDIQPLLVLAGVPTDWLDKPAWRCLWNHPQLSRPSIVDSLHSLARRHAEAPGLHCKSRSGKPTAKNKATRLAEEFRCELQLVGHALVQLLCSIKGLSEAWCLATAGGSSDEGCSKPSAKMLQLRGDVLFRIAATAKVLSSYIELSNVRVGLQQRHRERSHSAAGRRNRSTSAGAIKSRACGGDLLQNKSTPPCEARLQSSRQGCQLGVAAFNDVAEFSIAANSAAVTFGKEVDTAPTRLDDPCIVQSHIPEVSSGTQIPTVGVVHADLVAETSAAGPSVCASPPSKRENAAYQPWSPATVCSNDEILCSSPEAQLGGHDFATWSYNQTHKLDTSDAWDALVFAITDGDAQETSWALDAVIDRLAVGEEVVEDDHEDDPDEEVHAVRQLLVACA